jgi:agmatine deiminase
MDTLGANKVVWLEYGVYGDVDTDGHIDNVACFVNQDTVLLQACEDKNNPNYERTQSNINTLKQAGLNIIKMPQPPVLIENDIYYPLSYVNFVFVNGGVVMPTFGGICKQTDEEAVAIMEKVFPDRKIITVDGMPIIRGGGNVHCITQQIPEV